jgi:hypothetical protein
LYHCNGAGTKTKNKMEKQKTIQYSRVWCGKLLIANIISLDENKAVYSFVDSPKIIHKEYSKLFLSVFKIYA